MIKTCQRCGENFDGRDNAKYCRECRRPAKLEKGRFRYWLNREEILAQRKAKRAMTGTNKTCERCGENFDGRGKAKYCPDCRHELHKFYSLQYFYGTEKHLQVERVRKCEICGNDFEAKTRAKYCPDCREDAYKEKNREYVRLRRKARRVEKPAVKHEVKPVDAQKKQRLAYLRRRLDQAQTPEARRHYFRLYVLLKQEFLRGT